MIRRFMNYLRERALCILLPGNVALVDPHCGCLRSPDVRLSVPCPDAGSGHLRSTNTAFAALDLATMAD
jgi:hypothetical protein